MKFTADGQHVLLTANGGFNAAPAAIGAAEALTRQTFTHAARGLQIVDIADPAAPRLVGAYTAPIRLINVATWDTGGATYVAASVVQDRSIQGAPKPGLLANQIDILRLDLPDPTRVATWTPPKDAVEEVFAHDLSVQIHPITGRTILYAACWDAGAYLLDVTDPSSPREIGHFRPDAQTPHVHTVKPHPDLIDGRHYTLVSPETFAGEASGRYHMLDTTDPTQPKLVAAWQLPGDLTNPENLMWSPHEFSLANGKAYTSNDHAGVIVLDLPTLTPIAAWAAPPTSPRAQSARWSLDIETTVWHDDHVYDIDMGRGIDILLANSPAGEFGRRQRSIPSSCGSAGSAATTCLWSDARCGGAHQRAPWKLSHARASRSPGSASRRARTRSR